MDRSAWEATVHEVTKNWTQLKRLNTHVHIYMYIYMPFFVTGKREKRIRPICRGGANISCFSKSSGYAAFFWPSHTANIISGPDKGRNLCSLQCKL